MCDDRKMINGGINMLRILHMKKVFLLIGKDKRVFNIPLLRILVHVKTHVIVNINTYMFEDNPIASFITYKFSLLPISEEYGFSE